MEREKVEQKVLEIISEYTGMAKDQLTTELHLQHDLNIDSLGIMEIHQTAEDTFDATLPPEDFQSVKTIGDAVEYINGKLEG